MTDAKAAKKAEKLIIETTEKISALGLTPAAMFIDPKDTDMCAVAQPNPLTMGMLCALLSQIVIQTMDESDAEEFAETLKQEFRAGYHRKPAKRNLCSSGGKRA